MYVAYFGGLVTCVLVVGNYLFLYGLYGFPFHNIWFSIGVVHDWNRCAAPPIQASPVIFGEGRNFGKLTNPRKVSWSLLGHKGEYSIQLCWSMFSGDPVVQVWVVSGVQL